MANPRFQSVRYFSLASDGFFCLTALVLADGFLVETGGVMNLTEAILGFEPVANIEIVARLMVCRDHYWQFFRGVRRILARIIFHFPLHRDVQSNVLANYTV